MGVIYGTLQFVFEVLRVAAQVGLDGLPLEAYVPILDRHETDTPMMDAPRPLYEEESYIDEYLDVPHSHTGETVVAQWCTQPFYDHPMAGSEMDPYVANFGETPGVEMAQGQRLVAIGREVLPDDLNLLVWYQRPQWSQGRVVARTPITVAPLVLWHLTAKSSDRPWRRLIGHRCDIGHRWTTDLAVTFTNESEDDMAREQYAPGMTSRRARRGERLEDGLGNQMGWGLVRATHQVLIPSIGEGLCMLQSIEKALIYADVEFNAMELHTALVKCTRNNLLAQMLAAHGEVEAAVMQEEQFLEWRHALRRTVGSQELDVPPRYAWGVRQADSKSNEPRSFLRHLLATRQGVGSLRLLVMVLIQFLRDRTPNSMPSLVLFVRQDKGDIVRLTMSGNDDLPTQYMGAMSFRGQHCHWRRSPDGMGRWWAPHCTMECEYSQQDRVLWYTGLLPEPGPRFAADDLNFRQVYKTVSGGADACRALGPLGQMESDRDLVFGNGKFRLVDRGQDHRAEVLVNDMEVQHAKTVPSGTASRPVPGVAPALHMGSSSLQERCTVPRNQQMLMTGVTAMVSSDRSGASYVMPERLSAVRIPVASPSLDYDHRRDVVEVMKGGAALQSQVVVPNKRQRQLLQVVPWKATMTPLVGVLPVQVMTNDGSSFSHEYGRWLQPQATSKLSLESVELQGTSAGVGPNQVEAQEISWTTKSGFHSFGSTSLVANLLLHDKSPHRFNPPSGVEMLRHFLNVTAEAIENSAPESTKGIDDSAFNSWSRFHMGWVSNPVQTIFIVRFVISANQIIICSQDIINQK